MARNHEHFRQQNSRFFHQLVKHILFESFVQ